LLNCLINQQIRDQFDQSIKVNIIIRAALDPESVSIPSVSLHRYILLKNADLDTAAN